MLTNRQFNAIFEGFAKETRNEGEPIRKDFRSNGGKWCISTNRAKGVVTWYETSEDGQTVKYFDYLPESR